MARKSTVPKYRKHSSGNARVTINGRDYLLGPWNSRTSIREYDRIIAEYLASERSPSFGIEADAYTIAMLIRDYLRHCKAYHGTAKTSDYHRIKPALKPLRDLYADQEAAEFGPVGYKAIRQVMVDSGLSRQGVNRRMKKVVGAFKWAPSEAKLPAAVFGTLNLIPSLKTTTAPDAEPVTAVADDVVEVTINFLSPIVSDMVMLQRLIGCRPSEICNLTPGSFDRSDDVWVATLVQHKTAHHGHVRKLYAGPKAQEVIARYLNRDADTALFRPIDAVMMRREHDAANRTTPLSCGNRPGRKYDRGGLKAETREESSQRGIHDRHLPESNSPRL